MNLVMAYRIKLLPSNLREVKLHVSREWRRRMPRSVLPVTGFLAKLLEVYRRIEVCCKELIVDTSVSAKDIDSFYAI
ncbi:hypothetical protein HMPREF3289_16300 [Pseudomonas sp. HMSC75E02]|nr:hypothetical protein HMPREF3289_16300 [Pseudomonas sp. HMSC75E02]